MFFETFVSIDLFGLKEMILSFTQEMSKNLLCHYKLFPDVCRTRWNERKVGQIFFHWKDCILFQKIVFSAASLVLKKGFYIFHSDCQNILWSLWNFSLSLRFVALDYTKKKQAKFFVTGNIDFFLKCLFLMTS